MGTVEIVNTTPLQLQLRRYFGNVKGGYAQSEVLAELEPLGQTAKLDRPDGETLWVCANAGRSSVASFTVDTQACRFEVKPPSIGYSSILQLPADLGLWAWWPNATLAPDLRFPVIPSDSSFALSLLTSVTFVNASGTDVSLSFIHGGTRAETPTGQSLAPDRRQTVLHNGGLQHGPLRIASCWLARASSSGELLAMFVPMPDAEQTFTITDARPARPSAAGSST
jgi:hypothetical protein